MTKLIGNNNWVRNHRTLLVVEVNHNPGDDYIDRMRRLNESLNHDNIKCDIVLYSDGKLYAPGDSGCWVTQGLVPGGPLTTIDTFANKHGYVMVMTVRDRFKPEEPPTSAMVETLLDEVTK